MSASKEAHAVLPEGGTVDVRADWIRHAVAAEDGALFVLDLQGVVCFASRAAATFLGALPDELAGKPLGARVHADDRPVLARALLETQREREGVRRVDCRLASADGAWVHAEMSTVYSRTDGQPARILVHARDISARKSSEDANARAARWFETLTRWSADVITIFADDGACRYVSGSVENVLGWRADEVSWALFTGAIHPRDQRRVLVALEQCRERPEHAISVEYRARHKDGRYIHVESHAVNRIRDEEVAGLIVYTRDITERKVRDPLTGLPNRTLFLDRLQVAMENMRRDRVRHFAVLVLEPDRRDLMNGGLDHDHCDRFVIALARRLEASLRPSDTVARLDADRFALLLADIPRPEDVPAIIKRLQESLQLPFTVADRTLYTTVSVGVADGLRGYESPEAVLRAATAALSSTSSEGTCRVTAFRPEMLQRVEARVGIESELRAALARDELTLHYQPVVDLETGQAQGVEALVRWNHPVRGLLAPGEFVPVAEQTGLIASVGAWVLEQACQQVAFWRAAVEAPDRVVVNVNLAAAQLRDARLPERVDAILARYQIPASSLRLEVTESSIIAKPEAAARVLGELRERGVGIALDDFGTGYSSLSYLHRFPFDTIKIDRSFVRTLGPEAVTQQELVRTIVALGHNLRMRVVAEGIEEEAQRGLLRSLGCRLGQGYLFSRPVPPHQALAAFDDRRDPRAAPAATRQGLEATVHATRAVAGPPSAWPGPPLDPGDDDEQPDILN